MHAVVFRGVAEAVVPHAAVEEEDVAGLERDDVPHTGVRAQAQAGAVLEGTEMLEIFL